MYLKKMEVIGFKSFAQRTVLEFHEGITVVVGPNGCGKSNVLDSIRWALGEQSPKTLRGQSMTDIIFNGTQQMPPANYAEVTLTFSNEDNAMNIAYDEVSITRKLFRSGESEYRLNKAQVRLKDIHELLLSVGLGEGSYSFVMQGTIDRLLTQKPEKKRLIFDEAAGILQYKERKREVSRKLKDAEDNLLRVDDIIIEVKRQRDSLARQVQRAEKYKELRTELEELEKNLAVVKMKGIRERLDVLLDELNTLQERDAKSHVTLESLQAVCSEKDLSIEELRHSQEGLNRDIITLESRIENNRHKSDISNQRIQEAQQRLDSILSFKQQYTSRRADQEGRIEQLRKELNELGIIHEEVNARVGSIQLEIDAAQEFISGKGESILFIKDRITALEEEKISVSQRLREVYKEMDSFTVRKQRLNHENDKIQREIEDYKSRYEQLIDVLKDKEETLEQERCVLESKYVELENLSSEIEKTNINLGEKEKELLLLNSQIDFLNNMNLSYQDLPYEEEATILFSKELPELPAVLVGKIEKEPELEGGKILVTTNVKVISSNIEQFQVQINNLTQQIDSIKSKIVDLKQNREKSQKELSKYREQIQDKENELSRLKESENHFKESLDKLNESKLALGLELKEIDKSLSISAEKEAEVEETIVSKDKAIQDVQVELEGLQEQISLKQIELNQLEVEKAGIDTRLTTITGEKSGKEENVRIFSNDLQTMTSQFEALGQEEEELSDKRKTFELNIADIEVETESLLSEVRIKRDELQKVVAEEQEISEQRSLSEGRLREIEFEIEDIKKKTYDKKFELQNIQHEEEQICRDMLQLYDIEITAEELLQQEIIETPAAELISKEEELKRRLKYIGSVNLDAPREYEELNERYEFLVNQKQDLIDSRETLKKALQKINKTSREMFIETFEIVKEEFKQMFRFLFAGGKADVVLLDPDNVLESGVDIIVQPPGKKLQNVSLLSGGEKSMTAIALIFAIFKVKPSPLCILDEIDAALDEANVDRFNHVLRDFSKTSQFLVISHNKKTIGVADVMYGVTMQQSGVSNIVSVRLTDQENTSSSENKVTHHSEHGHDKPLLALDAGDVEEDFVDGELIGEPV